MSGSYLEMCHIEYSVDYKLSERSGVCIKSTELHILPSRQTERVRGKEAKGRKKKRRSRGRMDAPHGKAQARE